LALHLYTEYLVSLKNLVYYHIYLLTYRLGDFNLELLDYVEPSGLFWVGNTNELNAGYAADGYSRVKGLGALVTTFGVGELSAINAIAGSYAERAPVVHIVGTPNREIQDTGKRVHHTFNDGNFRRFAQMHAHVTVAQASLRNASTAPEEIDRVLQQCLLHSRPVYIEVPVDLVAVLVGSANLQSTISLPEPTATPTTDAALNQVLGRIYEAKRPIILVDGECRALGITADVQTLVKATRWPTWTTSYGRGLLDESHPTFYGVYKGAFDSDSGRAREFFEQADLILCFGPHYSTTNSYALTAIPKPETSITFTDSEVTIGSTVLRDVPARLIVSQLLHHLELHNITQYDLAEHESIAEDKPYLYGYSVLVNHHPIRHLALWDIIEQFIHPGDIVMGETGTAGFGVREMRTPENVQVFVPVTWLSIGYMLPAAQGAALAQRELHSHTDNTDTTSRTILFIGDGSLQMTVQEISTIIRLHLNVIIVVLNNNGYTIERAIHGLDQNYNDVAPWRYLIAPSFFGGDENAFTASAKTIGELHLILKDERLVNGKGLRMVELIMDKDDVPQGPLAKLMDAEKQRTRSAKHPTQT
jgi:pyruvate decarboxylase